jgi:hypothetical protein
MPISLWSGIGQLSATRFVVAQGGQRGVALAQGCLRGGPEVGTLLRGPRVVVGSPEPTTGWTEGLLHFGRPAVGPCGRVRRPDHNTESGSSKVSDDKDYSLDGKDREEWDRLWSARTQRLLPGECKLNLSDAAGGLRRKLVSVTITDEPPEFAARLWRGSEVCPVCGESTAGCNRVAANLDVIFEGGVTFGVGVWAHQVCFEKCPDTGIPSRIPW